MTPNTSASGGTLQPTTPSPPLSGQDLLIFLQNWLAPLTTLDTTLVRPRWQAEPSNIPDAGVAWMAFGFVGEEDSDTFPYQSQSADGLTTTLLTNEEMTLLCSFYDTGVTGMADALSRLLRDNVRIAQNREPLYLQGFDLAYVRPRVQVPSTLSNRWLLRVDLPIIVRCQFQRKYQVLSLLSMSGTVTTDSGYSFPVSADAGD